MDYLKILSYSTIFLIGFLSCMLIGYLYTEIEKPLIIGGVSLISDLEAPGDWIKERQINVYDNAVVINIDGASISRYAPTGSMKPILDKDSNGIRIIPESAEQIEIGDIITFEQDNDLVIHRVIDKREDEEGVYFITKGDNNNVTDGKIRFKDIRYVTIAVIW